MFEVQAVPLEDLATAAAGVPVDRYFPDLRDPNDPRFVIEWASIIGRTYIVLYSDDLQTWKAAVPAVTAAASRTQWYDDGPPKTESEPLGQEPRFYRVVLVPITP